MGSRFRPHPKTVSDRNVLGYIAAYDKREAGKYPERMAALNLLTQAVNKVKATEKQPDALTWLADVIKVADAERKALIVAAKKKAHADGAHDGAARRPSRAPEFAKVPEFMKAYVDGCNHGLKIETKPVMKAR